MRICPDTGPQGNRGPQGNQGSQGYTYISGAVGISGAVDTIGLQGYDESGYSTSKRQSQVYSASM